MKGIKRKGVLLIVSAVLLISALIYVSFAWYTKMTSITTTEFHVARWEFTADWQMDDFVVNVYRYSTLNQNSNNLENNKAAPGTRGELPIHLQAFQSDTDIDYTITLDTSTMSERFQERLFFYYLDKAGKPVYFKFDKEGGGLTSKKTTKYTGTLKRGQETEIKIYWDWVYDYDECLEHLESGVEPIETSGAGSILTPEEQFDEFDTQVGIHPELYASEMNATITIYGVQAKPVEVTTAAN